MKSFIEFFLGSFHLLQINVGGGGGGCSSEILRYSTSFGSGMIYMRGGEGKGGRARRRRVLFKYWVQKWTLIKHNKYLLIILIFFNFNNEE